MFRNALIITLATALWAFSATSFAGQTSYIIVSGKVWSIDSDNFIVQDASKKFWRIPRSVLKKNAELKSDQQITVQVPREDAKPYQVRNQ